ncbi:MAG: hypothetical protein OXC30_00490 [Alphaproteobacteria bacterium]|nr:hypothetical protein [Alphaproteobacteria bacterium]
MVLILFLMCLHVHGAVQPHILDLRFAEEVAERRKNSIPVVLVFSEAFKQISELADLFATGLVAAKDAIGAETSPLDHSSAVALMKKAFNQRVEQDCGGNRAQIYSSFVARFPHIKKEVEEIYVRGDRDADNKFSQLVEELDKLTGYAPATTDRSNHKQFDRAFPLNTSLEEESDPKNSFDKLAAQIKALADHTYIQEKSSLIYAKLGEKDAKIAQKLARHVKQLDTLTQWASQPSDLDNPLSALKDAQENAEKAQDFAWELCCQLSHRRGYRECFSY